jgi:hypothetical protein
VSEIDIKDLSVFFKSTDKHHKKVFRWLKKHGVTVYPIGDKYAIRKFVLEHEFAPAYDAYEKGIVPVTVSKEAIEKDEPEINGLTKIQSQMENVTLTPKQHIPGLFLTCSCRSKPLYKDNQSIKCNCKEFKFKMRIKMPGTKGDFKKVLDAKDYDAAVLEFIHRKKGLEDNSNQTIPIQKFEPISPVPTFMPAIQTKVRSITNKEPLPKTTFLEDAAEKYIQILNLEDGRIRKNRKQNSKANNQEADRYVYMFVDMLKQLGYNTATLPLEAIGDNETDLFANWLEEEQTWNHHGEIKEKIAYSEGTFNKAITRMSCFFGKIIERNKLTLANVWHGVERKEVTIDIRTIKDKDFEAMLDLINYDNGWTTESEYVQRRNLYHDWTKSAFLLGKFTAGRRSVISDMKWLDVRWNELGEPDYVKIECRKENLAKGKPEEKSIRPQYHILYFEW